MKPSVANMKNTRTQNGQTAANGEPVASLSQSSTAVAGTKVTEVDSHISDRAPKPSKVGVEAKSKTEKRGNDTNRDTQFDDGETEIVFERFPWQNIGAFNEGKKFDRSLLADSNLIRSFVIETFEGDLYWNTVLIVGTCFFSWLISKWRFGIFGLIFVLLCASSVYRAEYRRFQRNVRDDIHRVSAAERLEKNFESMEWLNNFLAKFWVIYMPELSKTVMKIANDTLKDVAPGYGIDALTLDQFTLGTKAPRIDSIKSYTKKGKDIVEWDWAFGFTPNDLSDMTKNEIDRKIDPKVALGVRVGKAMISKRLPILVEDMSCSGRAKITLQLSLNFPHIKIVSISLLEPPKIDFSLKPVGGDTFGLDVMSMVPGLSSLITNLINSNAGPMLYAPNHLDIDLEELTAEQSNDAMGVVAVTINGAEQFKEPINPYIQIFTEKEPTKVDRTEIKVSDKQVSWNETKYIMVSSLDQKLHLDLYDFNSKKKKGEIYGSHEFELAGLFQSESQLGLKKPLELAGKKKGFINYDIRWFPVLKTEKRSTGDDSKEVDIPDSEVGILKLTVHTVKKLDTTVAMTGKLNPRAELYINGEKIKDYRTLKNANEPSWETTDEFLITQKSRSNLSLIIKDTGSRNGKEIDSLKEDLETLVFNVSDGRDVFTMQNGSEVRITAVWKPVSLQGSGTHYVPPIGVGRLHIRHAEDLLNLEKVGEVDPYVKVLLNNRLKYQTSYHSSTCNPSFGDVVYFPIASMSQHLSLEFMDFQSLTKDRSLGTANIALSEFINKDGNGNYLFLDGGEKLLSSKLQLKNKSPKGTVFYSFSFLPAIPVYSPEEVADIKMKKNQLAEKREGDKEQLEMWTELHKKHPNDYEWVEIEDEDEAELCKKETMTLDQLLTYRSGTLGIHLLDGKVDKSDSFIQVLLDDQGTPSFVSMKTTGRKVNSEIGDAFVRDLPNSKITFRNSKKQTVKDADDVAGEVTLNTIDVLRKGYDKPFAVSLGNASIKLQVEYIPSAIKLPPSETILDTGMARIEFLDAESLVAGDRNGKSDPFISVTIGGIELFKSKVVKKTLNPTWNETTSIPIVSRSRSPLMLYVKDWDRSGENVVIGEARLDLSGVNALKSEIVTFDLKPHGTLRVRVTFAPEYIRPKVGNREFGGALAYLSGNPLAGVGYAASGVGYTATGIAGAGTGLVAHTGKGGSSLIKSVLGGKKSKKSNGNHSRPSMESDSRSLDSNTPGVPGSKAAAEKYSRNRSSSQASTYSKAAKGKEFTDGELIVISGNNLGKDPQLRVSIAIEGNLKEIHTTKKGKFTNGIVKWEEKISFSAPEDAEFVFGGVVHHTFGKDTELGTAKISLGDVMDSTREVSMDLGQGEIVVSFRYSPERDSREETPLPPAW